MKQYFFLISLFLAFGFSSGQQNLVPNGDFETKISCPNNLGELYKALGWINANNCTPDYFHQCGSGGFAIPNNSAGNEPAHSGLAYAGFYTYNGGWSNEREYIEVKLIDTLESGKKYLVTFWVSLSDNVRYATSNIGAYFSSSQITGSQCALFTFIPQVLNLPTNPLTSQSGWTRVIDTLIAQGGETFMTIGNFSDDSLTDTLNVGSGWNASYYYIEDVSVIDIGWVGINESNFNLVNAKLFPNPFTVSTTLTIEGYKTDKAELRVFDVLGNEISVVKNICTNEIVIEKNGLPPGIYFYSLSENNKNLASGKLVIQD